MILQRLLPPSSCPESSCPSVTISLWLHSIAGSWGGNIRSILLCIILWFLWKTRNEARFQGLYFSPQSLIFRIDQFLVQLGAAQRLPSSAFTGVRGYHLASFFCPIPSPARRLCVVKWLHPSPGRVKLNTDASSSSNLSIAAGLLRDTHGKLIFAFYKESSLLLAKTALQLVVKERGDSFQISIRKSWHHWRPWAIPFWAWAQFRNFISSKSYCSEGKEVICILHTRRLSYPLWGDLSSIKKGIDKTSAIHADYSSYLSLPFASDWTSLSFQAISMSVVLLICLARVIFKWSRKRFSFGIETHYDSYS